MGNFFVAYERCAIDFEAPKVSRIGRAEQHVLIYNWSTGWKYSEVKGVPLNSVNWKKYVFLFCRLSIKSVGLLATYYARSTMSHFSIRVFELEHKIRLSKNFVALNLRKVWSGCDILRPVKRWQMEEELHERRNKRFLFFIDPFAAFEFSILGLTCQCRKLKFILRSSRPNLSQLRGGDRRF